MATKGFEFHGMLDGEGTPRIMDWPVAADASGYKKGDLLCLTARGKADKIATGTDATAFAVCQETDTSSVASSTELKVALLTRNQIWRCSTDETALGSAVIKGYIRAVPVVDHDTIDGDGTTGGCMIVLGTAGTDSAGKVIAKVVFNQTIFDGMLS